MVFEKGVVRARGRETESEGTTMTKLHHDRFLEERKMMNEAENYDAITEFEEQQHLRAEWDADVQDCRACQAQDGDMPCAEHDLDDPEVAERYGLGVAHD